MTNLRSTQQGQTLLIVIFAMSLGLLVIVNTAGRALGSVARTTQTNFYQKATAVAEGGAEVFLAYRPSDLNDYIEKGKCPISDLSNLDAVETDCIVGLVESRAFLGLGKYPDPSTKESLHIKSQPGETIHISLQGLDSNVQSIRMCWKGLGKANYSVSHYNYYYGQIGSYSVDKDAYTCDPDSEDPYCSIPSGDIENVNVVQVSSGGYWCYALSTHNDSVALRIFTFPDGADYTITAYDSSLNPASFPQQGYRIVSIGEVTGAEGTSIASKKATRKKVTVEKTFPYPAGPWWDFAVTSINGTVSP